MPKPPPQRLAACLFVLSGLLAQPARAGPPNTAARQLAVTALAAHESGDYTHAAELYFQAHQLDPADGGFLFASARSLHIGRQWELAAVRYEAFLRIEVANPDYVARARTYLSEVNALREQDRALAASAARLALAVTPAAAMAEGTAPTAPASRRGPARTVALWSGAVVGLGGAAWLGATTWQRAQFDAAMAPGFAGGKVNGYADRMQAESDGRAIAAQQNWAWALLSAGATAALAAWLWPADDGAAR